MGYAEKKTQNNSKSNTPSVFNRSSTVNSSAAAAGENKPLYKLCNSTAFQRNGSFKSLYSSPYGSSVLSPGNSFKGKVKKLCAIFESPRYPLGTPNSQSLPSPRSPKPEKILLTSSDYSLVPNSPFRLPGTEDRVVIYFTSLRGVRRTFQDCHSIRMIFQGFRVNLDERDISLNVAYRNELQKVFRENNVSLPQVFIKGKYIGGADLIKQLLEVGELARLVKGLPLRPLKPCDACGDVRFMPCTNCYGSRKVFDEAEEQPKRCLDCNENGLMPCFLCCS